MYGYQIDKQQELESLNFDVRWWYPRIQDKPVFLDILPPYGSDKPFTGTLFCLW